MVLAATNYPWLIDEAFRRRFEKRVYIPLPDRRARRALLDLSLAGAEVDADANLDAVADSLEDYSGADIANVCRDAAMMAMRRAIKDKPLEELKKIKREDVREYAKFIFLAGFSSLGVISGRPPNHLGRLLRRVGEVQADLLRCGVLQVRAMDGEARIVLRTTPVAATACLIAASCHMMLLLPHA